MTILSIAQRCTQRLQITDPASFIGSTNNNYILLLAMINRAIDEISNEFEWPELTKHYPFKLIDGLDSYPLPGDYDRRINETLWNKDQHWPLIGPVTAQIWEQYINGFITTLPRQRFRVKGCTDNQFFINPTPEGIGGQTLVYEYISKNKRRPKSWTANTAMVSGTTYRFWNGLILLAASTGTPVSTQAPVYGPDGSVVWEPIPAYVASQLYFAGQFVYSTSSGNVYEVTQGGVSSAGDPSVTSGSETLGTVVFEFVSTPGVWAAGTTYAEGDYVTNPSAPQSAYYCINAGVSGVLNPKFWCSIPAVSSTTAGYPIPYTITKKISDGDQTWHVYEAEYSFTADTDEIVLNEQMIVDGACWRFLQARGFDYMQDKAIADEQKEAIKANKIGASSVDLGYQAYAWPWCIGTWSYPSGNFNPPS